MQTHNQILIKLELLARSVISINLYFTSKQNGIKRTTQKNISNHKLKIHH